MLSLISASTPRVEPLPFAKVFISEILPRITSNFIFFTNSTAVRVRSSDAPTPTGSIKLHDLIY